ncbi:MAG TPA: neutral zinc metallopeptidase [Acidimicrobiia bacterium]|nr:neutral zinc metallopeptidase [Acidimicrobiia bacterium]
MRWRRGTRSGRVQDRRSAGGSSPFPGGGGGGGLGGLSGLTRLGIPGILILVVLGVCFGGDIFGGGGQLQVPMDVEAPTDSGGLESAPDPDDELFAFMEFLEADIQELWAGVFQQAGEEYSTAGMVIFTDQTESACGGATSAVGPHYCPPDQTVYLDLDFFRELRSRFGASGDFAHAYVVAHEFGHHVQNVTGIMQQVQSQGASNDLSVKLELQADCLAGVWAQSVYARGEGANADVGLEQGDLEEALGAAEAVGDDRIQAKTGQMINPEGWTHGSAEQRATWFRRGFDTGNPNSCDTFSE